MRKPSRDSLINAGIAAVIVGTTFAVFWQVHDFPYLSYEDNLNVTENPYVSQGVTWDNIVAAFTRPQNGNWSPVATLTHMIDVDIFGLDPGPPHAIHVFFHCSNTLALFLLLWGMTRARWPSAFVAALFALHPLHVEPVAWISGRKFVLGMHFTLMTVRLYVQYVEKRTWKLYALAIAHFLAALFTSTVVITLPILLLLLDYWPLRRLADTSPVLAEKRRVMGRLVREKIPFFLSSVLVGTIVWLVLRAGGAAHNYEKHSLYERVANAVVSPLVYIRETIWPVHLIPYYPFSGAWPAWSVAGATLVLIAITAAAILRMRKSPYFIVGWGWWLIALLPVSGLVQIGSFARADRFTYLPHIGLFMVIAWGVEEVTRRVPQRRQVLAACAVVLFVPMIAATYQQSTYWRNTFALFEHTLAVSPENPVGHNMMGLAFMKRAQSSDAQATDMENAEANLQQAVQIAPAYVDARSNLGIALLIQGKDGSAEQFEKAYELAPNNPVALLNAANALMERGSAEKAIAMYQRAIAMAPRNVQAHYNLGIALGQAGQLDDAVAAFRAAVALEPGDGSLRAALANGLLRLGRVTEAAEEALEAVKLDPENADAQYNLGVAQDMLGRTEQALESLHRAVELEPGFVDARLYLAERPGK